MAAIRLTIAFLLMVSGPSVGSAWADGDLVTVCHVSPAGAKEIVVSASATAALLRQHPADALGACPAPAACPCWTGDDLRAALAALPDDPASEQDPMLGDCELSLSSPVFQGNFSATLFFGDAGGSDGQRVSVNVDPDEQRCFISPDIFELGLEPVDVPDLTRDEAVACARIIGEICTDVLR